MDNPVSESRAKIERALGKTAPDRTAEQRKGGQFGASLSLKDDRMLSGPERAERNLRSTQPRPAG